MKQFKIENKNTGACMMKITLHNPPYENENILYKTGLKEKDVTITEITPTFEGEEE